MQTRNLPIENEDTARRSRLWHNANGYQRLVTTKDGKSERTLQESVCPILQDCGKCHLLNMPYKEQLISKSQMTREKILALGADFSHVSVKDCMESPAKLAYRHSVHLKISEHKSLADERGVGKRRIDIGFYQPELKRVVDIGRCAVQTISLNHIIAWLRTGIRIHNVSVQTYFKKEGLLESVILHSTQTSKQIFVCFVVTQLNSAQLRPLACDIAAKFSHVRGIFMKLRDDNDTTPATLLTGHADIQENFLGKQFQQTMKSIFHPNIPMVEKMGKRISDIQEIYGGKENVPVVSSNFFLSTVMECHVFEDVLKQKPPMVCFVSSLSQSAEKTLKIFKEHHYNPLFVEPFDMLPGTDYCENIILLSKEKSL